MKKKIYVTAKNIKDGKSGDSGECPVALAFKDAGFHKTQITFARLFTIQPHEMYGRWYPLSRSVKRFVVKFDDKKKVKPFAFFFDSSKGI